MQHLQRYLYPVALAGGITFVSGVCLVALRHHYGRKGGTPRVALVIVVALGLLLSTGSAAGAVWRRYTAVRLLNSSSRINIPTAQPRSKHDGLVNFLVLGSDKRVISGYAGGPGDQGNNSDVIMLVSVNPDSKVALVLSIPRDYYVELPGQGHVKINAGLSLGGPAQEVAMVHDLTGIPINHFVGIDFEGFVQIVDALGGVDLPLPYPARDSEVGLNRPAGTSHYDGINALGYVRSRYIEFLINGTWQPDPESDLGRIRRQQDFLDELLQRALALDAIAQAPHYADLIGRALQLDSTFTPADVLDLLTAFTGVRRQSLEYCTLPGVGDDLGGVSYVFPKEPDADILLNFLGGHSIPDSSLTPQYPRNAGAPTSETPACHSR
jgi:LCP family protein required for cell wall assembly